MVGGVGLVVGGGSLAFGGGGLVFGGGGLVVGGGGLVVGGGSVCGDLKGVITGEGFKRIYAGVMLGEGKKISDMKTKKTVCF